MASFPERAKVVIIGQGGIVGASVVHHLIERGWDNIVGIDKSAIPTDVGSTAHASDFCFNTMHDQMTIFTTRYSIDFYERLGRYERIGGLEVARVGDDERMQELQRRVPAKLLTVAGQTNRHSGNRNSGRSNRLSIHKRIRNRSIF